MQTRLSRIECLKPFAQEEQKGEAASQLSQDESHCKHKISATNLW
jgi:hypothetical protein